MSSNYWDRYLNELALALARWSAEAAGGAVLTLLKAFGASTEPNLAAIANAYGRTLAVALILAGAFISLALLEHLLGGHRGAGWSVVPRTLSCVFLAFSGLGLLDYATSHANLLAQVWTLDFISQNHVLAAKVAALYAPGAINAPALGSIGGLILTALLTLLLALILYVELILRAALILVSATFLPLLCVMAIWPRLAAAAFHLAEFLFALLMSKFVIATAVYVGYSLIVSGFLAPPDQVAANAMVVGLATLTVAAIAPIVLLQGVSFGQLAAAPLVRGLGNQGYRTGAGFLASAAKPLKAAGQRLGVGNRLRALGSRFTSSLPRRKLS